MRFNINNYTSKASTDLNNDNNNFKAKADLHNNDID